MVAVFGPHCANLVAAISNKRHCTCNDLHAYRILVQFNACCLVSSPNSMSLWVGLPIVALFIHPKRAQFIAAKQKQGVRIAPLVNGNQC